MSAATVCPSHLATRCLTPPLLPADEPQWSGVVPTLPPPPVLERLSDETVELMQYAHITHTKQVAMEWRKLFLPYRYDGVLSEDARIDAAKL